MGQIAGRRVTVLGAGVAGLAVARALALRGAIVTVLEQAEAIREVGAGLQVSPNGAGVLQALGLGAALNAVTCRGAAVELWDGLAESRLVRMPVGDLDPARGWHFLHRADLIEVLRAGAVAAGVQLRLWHRAASVSLAGARPMLMLDQGHQEADILIGADGLHSVTRAALNGPVAPFFTRQAAWRAVIPNDPARDGIDRAEVHLGPGRHLVSYPLRGGTLRNIVAVEERDHWVEESWSLRADPLELRLAFEDFGPRVRAWLDRVEETHLWGLFRHPVAQVWARQMPEGAVAILGDAAHPTLPFLAQGACMALEDAWVLAEALDRGDLPAYQTLREARCRRIVEAANTNARLWHLRGVSRAVAHLGLRGIGALAPGALLGRFDWLYKADVTDI
ncbi:FAD-dependent monooxygenase [Rhodobacter sp. KR11]|uniref:FAD-dependent monooxygenase n=1 Tax=Rhodobacter sp. KR11 TaxID=2974588 RepID=UPI002223C57B|nr:FAD-dependent monooxygenase [Rhodobacter sp. KR11]MCW1919533.1 FAD-dependent monooxygenase [Rhodobacter sp. KR11]